MMRLLDRILLWPAIELAETAERSRSLVVKTACGAGLVAWSPLLIAWCVVAGLAGWVRGGR